MSSKLLLAILFITLAVAVSGKDYCAQWQEIKNGDTCWKMIQGKKNLTLDVLKKMNPKLDCDKLQVGDKLCMAMTGGQLKCTKGHKIQAGDTCFKIWTANKITERQFMDWNDGIDCNKLQAGKQLCVMRQG